MADNAQSDLDVVSLECARQVENSDLPGAVRARLSSDGDVLFIGHPRSIATLPLAAFEACGGQGGRGVAASGAAVEFLLAAGDILDDIQDYVPAPGGGHAGPERALFVGQTELLVALLLLSECSMAALGSSSCEPRRVLRAARLFSDFKLKSFAGQYDDAHVRIAVPLDPNSALLGARKKSGSLGRLAGLLGATLATDDEHLVLLAGDFGENLAVASQLNNDIADLWPGTGKMEDLAGSRNTVPIAFAVAVSFGDTGPVPWQAPSTSATVVQSGLQARAHLEKASAEVFSRGGVQFALMQVAVHISKARTAAEKIREHIPGARLLSLLEGRDTVHG